MPDAQGRFKGISVPEIPWHATVEDKADREIDLYVLVDGARYGIDDVPEEYVKGYEQGYVAAAADTGELREVLVRGIRNAAQE